MSELLAETVTVCSAHAIMPISMSVIQSVVNRFIIVKFLLFLGMPVFRYTGIPIPYSFKYRAKLFTPTLSRDAFSPFWSAYSARSSGWVQSR